MLSEKNFSVETFLIVKASLFDSRFSIQFDETVKPKKGKRKTKVCKYFRRINNPLGECCSSSEF